MFWRASVHQWRVPEGECKRIRLGPYEDRLYLAGAATFPDHCTLWVSLAETATPLESLSLTPYGGRRAGYHVYKLLVRGVGFHLLVGKQIPYQLRRMCFVRGDGNPIWRTDMLNEAVLQDVHYMFARHPKLLEGPERSAGPNTAS